jgi:hypothetical protein
MPNALEGLVMSMHSLLHTSSPETSDSGIGRAGLGLFDAITRPPLDVGEAADCCCATAQVRVVLPPVAGRSGRPELRLCAHHYRSAAAGLERAGADIYDAQGHWLAGRGQVWAEFSGPTTSAAGPPA